MHLKTEGSIRMECLLSPVPLISIILCAVRVSASHSTPFFSSDFNAANHVTLSLSSFSLLSERVRWCNMCSSAPFIKIKRRASFIPLVT